MELMKKEQLILLIIKFSPVIAIILSSIFITSYISTDYLNDLKKEKNQIKENFIKSNKNKIKINIDSISELIENKLRNEKIKLKKDLEDNINIAHDIAMNIYYKNKNTLSKEEIITHIKNSLESLSFNQKEGYFSIHTMDGVNILQPIKRKLEGTLIINKKDSQGQYTIKNAINIAKTKGEGFMTWYSTKADDTSKEFKKIGIVKKFEPYDLIITTGRFLDDYNKQLEKELINLIKVIKYQDDGYIFIINEENDFLLTKSSLSNFKDVDKRSMFKENFYKFKKSNKKTSYIEYIYKENNLKYHKIAYLKKIPNLNWIIATGFDYDDLNSFIFKKQKELEKKHKEVTNIILLTSFAVTLLFLFFSLFISRLIENMFYEYKQKLLEKETLKFERIMEELNLILDHLPMMMIFKDTKNNIIRVNKTLADKINLSVEELRNVPTKEIFPNNYKEYYKDDLEVIKTKKEKLGIVEKFEIANKIRVVETSKIPIFDKNEEVQNIVAFFVDISEKEALKEDNLKKETLLYQQSKMATMGEMIANIAHQWKQPLSTISISATGCKVQKEMNCLSDKDLLSSLEMINNSTQYLAQTIDDFRNFFNPNSNNYSKFKISSPLNKTLNLLMPKYKTQDIEIIKDIKDIEILSLENEIIQVLINIFNNARDELIKHKQKRLIFIKTYKKEDLLVIEIKDNAGGIKEDIINKIFDAYFTTKENNQGTGIGLYMSKDILIKLLDAQISIENDTFTYENIQYKGANFIITIPVS